MDGTKDLVEFQHSPSGDYIGQFSKCLSHGWHTFGGLKGRSLNQVTRYVQKFTAMREPMKFRIVPYEPIGF